MKIRNHSEASSEQGLLMVKQTINEQEAGRSQIMMPASCSILA
jgi:hypothetical protein